LTNLSLVKRIGGSINLKNPNTKISTK